MPTASQIHSPVFQQWCAAIDHPVGPHRKLWEWVYIARALECQGALRAGKRGLGFGVGRERLVSAFAARGCEIVATDMAADAAEAAGWTETAQYSGSLAGLNTFGLCPAADFDARVGFRVVDMNAIPADLRSFDFLWSSCALEHLGSLQRGWNFVLASLDCLKPGGVAVHTTEFNLSSGTHTVERGPTVFYRESDVLELAAELRRRGSEIRLNLGTGDGADPIDRHLAVDVAKDPVQLKILESGYAITSLGMTIVKPAT
jgi:hypothetical protein